MRALALGAGLAALLAGTAVASPPTLLGGRDGRLMGTQLNVPVRSLVEMRFEKVVHQTADLSCGAAALATILKYYYGKPVDEIDVIDRMLVLGDREKILREGFSMLELKHYAEDLGFVSMGFRIDDTFDLEKIQVPVVALTNLGLNHFVVLRSASDGYVYIADPFYGNLKVPLEVFDGQWTHVVLAVLSAQVKGDPTFAKHVERHMDERTVQDLISMVRNTSPRARGFGDF